MKNSAIIIVDMQYDFIDGTLACTNAENAVASTKAYLAKCTDTDEQDENGIADTVPVLFTRDCHPADHCSFTANGGTWPVHCVDGQRGSKIHSALASYINEDLVFCKGCNKNAEQYSGFEGCNAAGQSMAEVLELMEITDVYVCGIATEFCVKNTAEDLLKAGMKVHIVKNCLAWVDAQGHENALAQMAAEGISIE